MNVDKAELWLRGKALAMEGAVEDFPWGHRAIKVGGRMFFILARAKGALHVTAKLPLSGERVLDRGWAVPTGYGMGKHGWVTATFPEGERVPVEELESWIAESWKAVVEGGKKNGKKSAKKKAAQKKSGTSRKAGRKVKSKGAAQVKRRGKT